MKIFEIHLVTFVVILTAFKVDISTINICSITLIVVFVPVSYIVFKWFNPYVRESEYSTSNTAERTAVQQVMSIYGDKCLSTYKFYKVVLLKKVIFLKVIVLQ